MGVQASIAAGTAQGQPDRGGMPQDGQRGFWSKLLKPLRDFGFGSKTFWEGGVGLFIFAGIGESLLPVACLTFPIAFVSGLVRRKRRVQGDNRLAAQLPFITLCLATGAPLVSISTARCTLNAAHKSMPHDGAIAHSWWAE